MIPEYDVVVIDEAHELVSRVTQAATDELSVARDRPHRRAGRSATSRATEADDLADAGDALRDAIDADEPGRSTYMPEQLADALALVRDAARALVSAFPKERPSPGEGDAAATQAKGWAQELFKTAERMAAGSEKDVLWIAASATATAAATISASPRSRSPGRCGRSCSPRRPRSSPRPRSSSAATSTRSPPRSG